MKYIITLALTILLTGNFTPEYQLIADKYSTSFGKDIAINVTDNVGNKFGVKNCNSTDVVTGCTYWFDVPYIEVTNKDLRSFEYAMVHEAVHVQTGFKDEMLVHRITNSMMK